MRSLWKGNFVSIKKKKLCKNSVILNTFLQKSFFVHNGKVINDFIVKREHIGFKAGEFIFTRKVGVMHKKKIKLKKGKK